MDWLWGLAVEESGSGDDSVATAPIASPKVLSNPTSPKVHEPLRGREAMTEAVMTWESLELLEQFVGLLNANDVRNLEGDTLKFKVSVAGEKAVTLETRVFLRHGQSASSGHH
jgi:hypothetical protein